MANFLTEYRETLAELAGDMVKCGDYARAVRWVQFMEREERIDSHGKETAEKAPKGQ